jgi:hypothetical protein
MKSCGNHKLAGDGPETRLWKRNRTTDSQTVMVNVACAQICFCQCCFPSAQCLPSVSNPELRIGKKKKRYHKEAMAGDDRKYLDWKMRRVIMRRSCAAHCDMTRVTHQTSYDRDARTIRRHLSQSICSRVAEITSGFLHGGFLQVIYQYICSGGVRIFFSGPPAGLTNRVPVRDFDPGAPLLATLAIKIQL